MKSLFKILVFLQLLLSVSLTHSNEFNVLYDSSAFHVKLNNCPQNALKAVEFSLRVFDSLIVTAIPINLEITFQQQSSNAVGATAKSSRFVSNFSPLTVSNVLYPISLAEKIANRQINNSDEPDIECFVSLSQNWSYSIDSIDSNSHLDFIQIFMHEICHGLGVQSLLSFSESEFNPAQFFSIYDQFITDEKNVLIKDYDSVSLKYGLYHLVTSDNLFFRSKYFQSQFNDSLIKLFAPFDYKVGNSIHHVDESSYDSSLCKLMSPHHKLGEIQRQLGFMSKSILEELGWSLPVLTHHQIYDSENVSDSTPLIFRSVGNTSSIVNPILSYSFDNFSHAKISNLEITDSLFRTAIPNLGFNAFVDYRFSLTNNGVVINYPCDDCSMRFYRGTDTIKPIINYGFASYILAGDEYFNIRVDISDNSNMMHLRLSSSISGEEYNDSVINSSLNIPIKVGSLTATDSLIIYLELRDYAEFSNYIYDTLIVPVISFGDILTTYSSDFESSNSDDFLLNGFSISQNLNFSSTSLNSQHPYKSPQIEQDTIVTFAQLKSKIIIDSVFHYLTFDEIVLVEPGDDGKQYGEFGYWDYVIVEGSKDSKIWHAFEKHGYDAQTYSDCYESYVSILKREGENLNSLFVPITEDLYHSHTINLVENKHLRKGDTISIRFRLMSDAFSNGWGWSIDNLEIQKGVTVSVSDIAPSFAIYPNPVTDYLDFGANVFDKYRIINFSGQSVIEGIYSRRIDISNLSSGMYTVQLISEKVTTGLFKKE